MFGLHVLWKLPSVVLFSNLIMNQQKLKMSTVYKLFHNPDAFEIFPWQISTPAQAACMVIETCIEHAKHRTTYVNSIRNQHVVDHIPTFLCTHHKQLDRCSTGMNLNQTTLKVIQWMTLHTVLKFFEHFYCISPSTTICWHLILANLSVMYYI